MKVEDLRDSVKGIHMKEEMRREVIGAVRERTEKKAEGDITRRTTAAWRKVAAAAAVLIAVSGIAAFPVRAFVNSLLQERLEAMPKEAVEEVYDTAARSQEEADTYSRAYTDSEKTRYQELAGKYLAGTFPEGEIPQADSEEDVKEDELCFIVPRSTFYLPDRELTDEEILEIIDFSVKRDYAFRQKYEKEYEQELAQREETEQKQIADNVENGGITQQQAVEIAAEKFYTFFESDGEGMELNSYYSETGHNAKGEAVYCVTWSHPVTHKCYYMELSAQDGRVTCVHQNNPGASDISDLDLAAEEAKERIGVLRESAEAFMEEKAGAAYENVYVYYLECMDGTVLYYAGVRFVFEKPDQSAYGVTYDWDGSFSFYMEVDLADYQEQDGKPIVLHARGEEIELMQVFQKLDEE